MYFLYVLYGNTQFTLDVDLHFCRCSFISLFLVSYLSCTVLLVAEISDKIHTRETNKATADKANQDYMKQLFLLAFLQVFQHHYKTNTYIFQKEQFSNMDDIKYESNLFHLLFCTLRCILHTERSSKIYWQLYLLTTYTLLSY